MVVDFRCRPPTPEFNKVFEPSAGDLFERFGYPRPSSMTLEELFKAMDEAGVAKIVAIGRDAETTLALRVPNDHVADLGKKYPERIVGFAGIDVRKGGQAIRDVEKAVGELGLSGIGIDPALNQLHPNDARIYPIYAKCQDLGVPVVVTTGFLGDHRYNQVLPLGDVAADFPGLTIIASHTWPWVREAIYLAVKFRNFYFELSGYFSWSGCEQVVDAVNRLVPHKFLFASAFPYCPPLPRVVGRFKQFYSGFKPEVMEKVLYGNAEHILQHRRG